MTDIILILAYYIYSLNVLDITRPQLGLPEITTGA